MSSASALSKAAISSRMFSVETTPAAANPRKAVLLGRLVLHTRAADPNVGR